MMFFAFNAVREKLCDQTIGVLPLFYRDLFDISHRVLETAEAIRMCFR
jgi:hypothetical protein